MDTYLPVDNKQLTIKTIFPVFFHIEEINFNILTQALDYRWRGRFLFIVSLIGCLAMRRDVIALAKSVKQPQIVPSLETCGLTKTNLHSNAFELNMIN